MLRTNSDLLHDEAVKHLVGGVNSPVRAFKSVYGSPIYFKSAKGAIVTDEDGNELVDFVQSWGPLIHGHANQEIINNIQQKMANGTSFGAPHVGEIDLAKKVKSRISFIEKIRFVSSGTEAVMSAVRLARGYTGRDKIVKFDGCYHGHIDSLLVNSGSGLATFGIASSPGIPADTVSTTIVCPLDDENLFEHVMKEYGGEIAAVIIEPMPANNGLLIQRKNFIEKIRTYCDKYGCLLIFDEVITGFRFPEGSISGLMKIEPDLITLGKVIGGGLPVGAYGGKAEIMDKLAPIGPVYQAGTLSGNPLAMAAGLSTLNLLDSEAYEKLENLGSMLENGVRTILGKYNFPMRIVRSSSLFWFSPGTEKTPKRADEIPNDAGSKYLHLHKGLLEKGYMLAPSVYEVGFISTAHNEEHIRGFISALDEVLLEIEVR